MSQSDAPIPFLKMHGLGNDFVIVDLRGGKARLNEQLIRSLGDRQRGIGFDQFITIEDDPNPMVAAFMGIWNPDGSRAEACGNATRCVASLLLAERDDDEIRIRTEFDLLACARSPNGMIRVDMGAPKLEWEEIPLKDASDTVRIDVKLGPIDDPVLWGPGAVNLGNPHAVFFVDDVENYPVDKVGPMVENHPMFPERTNVEFVEVLGPNRIRMRVWERGAGITQACGSGACASVVAGVRRKLIERRCVVILDGGPLAIEWNEGGRVLMTGPVAKSFEGLIRPEFFETA